ncbi:MAG: MOFRL family protein [Planctomycetota bacterium]
MKGGRLALAAAGAAGRCTFAISDVPEHDLAALASGPTVPDPTSGAAVAAALAQCRLGPALPPALAARLSRGDLPPRLQLDDPLARDLHAEILLDNDAARASLRRRCEQHESSSSRTSPSTTCPATTPRPACSTTSTRCGACTWAPGRGADRRRTRGAAARAPRHRRARQHFALACALRIAGEPIAVLSAGTDGIDGNSPAAGAVADGSTVARAAALGLEAAAHLRRCDAFPLFLALGDAIVTGPTGQNVRDLRLVVAAP